MIKLIKGLIIDALTIALTIGLYVGIANGLILFWGPHFILYDIVNAVNDTQMIFCILCFWNMFFGPYSRTLKKVANYLPGGRKAKKTDDYT